MKIPTVTGLMDTSQLGYTLIHEHAVTCCDWSMRMCLRGQFCQEDRLLEMAVIQLKKAKAAGIDTASGVPNKNKVGSITLAQAEEIAKTKMPDLNAASLEAAVSMIKGTARSMGVTVEG